MPRSKITKHEGDAMETSEAPKRTRTYMHTARIISAGVPLGDKLFGVMLNGKLTAQFRYFANTAELDYIPDIMGSYEGFPKWYRANPDVFTTLLLTKAEDSEVAAAQADRFAAESFLRTYLDRLTVKAQLEDHDAQIAAGIDTPII